MRHMLSTLVKRSVHWLGAAAARAEDDEDTRLQKSLLLAAACTFAVAGLIWALMYLATGQWRPALIPLLYSLITTGSISAYVVTRRYHLFRFSQLGLMLLLPWTLQLSLGGFTGGSAVVIWSWAAVMGALLFAEVRQARWWLAGFIALVVLAGLIESVRPMDSATSRLVTFLFVGNIVGVSVITFALTYHFVAQKDRFLALLRMEQEKSERLLLNILPSEIARQLKDSDGTIAQRFDSSTVLFADVVNFTPLSGRLPPEELVELLNEVFSHFDTLVERHGLEKIKTIGDRYMAAAGVPLPREDHATAATEMALQMLDYIYGRAFGAGRHKLELRVGINSGPLVAGVIGRKKFIYDLWGDTVNVASRMESQGVSGRVQVSRLTYELIRDDFECEPQSTLSVKGKGDMEVWHVTGRRPSRAREAVSVAGGS
jgi:adenylate cyclase